MRVLFSGKEFTSDIWAALFDLAREEGKEASRPRLKIIKAGPASDNTKKPGAK